MVSETQHPKSNIKAVDEREMLCSGWTSGYFLVIYAL